MPDPSIPVSKRPSLLYQDIDPEIQTGEIGQLQSFAGKSLDLEDARLLDFYTNLILLKVNLKNKIHIDAVDEDTAVEVQMQANQANDENNPQGIATTAEQKASGAINSKGGPGNKSTIKTLKQYDLSDIRLLINQKTDQVIRLYERDTGYSGEDLRAATKQDVTAFMYSNINIVDKDGNRYSNEAIFNNLNQTFGEGDEKFVFNWDYLASIAYNVTEPVVFEELGDSLITSSLHTILNATSHELIGDPTTLLNEEKLIPVITQAVKKNAISPVLGTKILGYDVSEKEGLIEEAGESYEFDSAPQQNALLDEMVRNQDVLSNILDVTMGALDEDYLEFFETNTKPNQDFTNKIIQKIDADSTRYFVEQNIYDPIAVDVSGLATSSSKFTQFIEDIIDNLGGVSEPSKHINENGKGLQSWESKAYGDVNRTVIKNAKQIFDLFVAPSGEIFSGARDEGYKLGLSPDEFVADRLQKAVSSYFVVNDQTGINEYQAEVNKHTEAGRRKLFEANPRQAENYLSNALAENEEYYVDGAPVTKSMIDPELWKSWTKTYTDFSEEEALAFIGSNIEDNVADFRFADDASRIGDIIRFAEGKGILDAFTSPAFRSHFTNVVAPRIAKDIRYSDVAGTQEIADLYNSAFDELTAMDKSAVDFDRLTDPVFTSIEGGPKVPGFPGLTIGQMKGDVPPEFDLEGVSEELQELSMERPEYAEFVMNQMGSTDFLEAWKAASVPQRDTAGIRARLGGETEDNQFIREKQRARLKVVEDLYADAVNRGELTDEITSRLEEAQEIYERETRIDAETGVGLPVGDEFMPGGFARKMIRDEFTTPGLTSQEFLKEQLPGFERRYKDSPFFKQEEDRLERERRETLRRRPGTQATIVRRGRR